MTAPRVAMRPDEAVRQLVFMLSWLGEGRLPVYLDGLPNPTMRERCESPHTPRRVANAARHFDFDSSFEVAVGLPRTAEFVYNCTILWAWVKTGEQERRAAKFTPAPAVVLKVGDSKERLMIWPLRNHVLESRARDLNGRLSYALHAPRTRGVPERLRVPLPGTFMRVGRLRPAPIVLTRFDADTTFEADEVAGALREPPALDAWREKANA